MSAPTTTKPSPKKPPTTFDPNRNDFRRKLGYYLTGLAIGLVLLGGFEVMKRVMGARGQSPNGQMAK